MIPSIGFCFYLRRLREERGMQRAYSRTIGKYSCFWNGIEIPYLLGLTVERGGPSDNTKAVGDKNNLRICPGTYPLAAHSGPKYRTIGYKQSLNFSDMPRPGILLKETGERTEILIHPGQDYVWSAGCINLASRLVNAESRINYVDSRQKVVDIIDFVTSKIQNSGNKDINYPECIIIIED